MAVTFVPAQILLTGHTGPPPCRIAVCADTNEDEFSTQLDAKDNSVLFCESVHNLHASIKYDELAVFSPRDN